MKSLYEVFPAFFVLHMVLAFALAQFNNGSPLRLLHPAINTPTHLIETGSPFNITTEVEGYSQRVTFVLETNQDLLTQGTRIKYLDSHGNARNTDPQQDLPYHITKGSVWTQVPGRHWESVGWARLTVIRDGLDPVFDGTFTVQSEQYEIRLNSKEQIISYPSATSNSTENLHDELSLRKSACMASPGSSLGKRQSSGGGDLIDTIGSTSGCPGTKLIAYVGIATDCSYRAAFNSVDAVQRNVINVVNTASVVFENSFNIALGIRDLHIVDGDCSDGTRFTPEWNAPCSVGDLNWRLDRFSSWRAAVEDDNAYWSLLTSCFVPEGEIGVSWVGEVCNSGVGYYTPESGIGVNVVGHSDTEWQVFAHESAHTFGAIHDCDSNSCASGLDSTSVCCPLSASTCNATGNVCSKIGLGDVDTKCLVGADKEAFAVEEGVILTDSQCGNGKLESGEACDCGGDSCNAWEASCCDMMTCQWRDEGKCHRSKGGDNGDSNGHKNSVADIWVAWIDGHRSLFIGLCVGLGGLLVLLVVLVIVLACRRRRQRKLIAKEPAINS